MPRIITDNEDTKENKLAQLKQVKPRDHLKGKDGTEYEVLTVHPEYRSGRSTREMSLSLLNLSNSRGYQQSISEWVKDGIYVPFRQD